MEPNWKPNVDSQAGTVDEQLGRKINATSEATRDPRKSSSPPPLPPGVNLGSIFRRRVREISKKI